MLVGTKGYLEILCMSRQVFSFNEHNFSKDDFKYQVICNIFWSKSDQALIFIIFFFRQVCETSTEDKKCWIFLVP